MQLKTRFLQDHIPHMLNSKVGTWLVGFSIHLWDKTPQDYNAHYTVSVLSNLATGASSPTLINGIDYEFVASGTWINGGTSKGDAEFNTKDDWATHIDGYDIAPYFLGEGFGDLQVNLGFVDWVAYSSTHEYTMPFTGTGAAVNFRVFDGDTITGIVPGWYGDNSGILTVDIYGPTIPFQASFIEPVPANNYNPLGL